MFVHDEDRAIPVSPLLHVPVSKTNNMMKSKRMIWQTKKAADPGSSYRSKLRGEVR